MPAAVFSHGQWPRKKTQVPGGLENRNLSETQRCPKDLSFIDVGMVSDAPDMDLMIPGFDKTKTNKQI